MTGIPPSSSASLPRPASSSRRMSQILYEQLQEKELERLSAKRRISTTIKRDKDLHLPPNSRKRRPPTLRREEQTFLMLMVVAAVLLLCCFLILSLHMVGDSVQNDLSRYMTTKRQQTEHTIDHQQPQNVEQQEIEVFTDPIRPMTTTRRRSKPKSQPIAVSKNNHNERHMITSPEVPHFYSPYWNLTCPLELSMFSGVHMDSSSSSSSSSGGHNNGEDYEYLHRAWAAREVSEKAVTFFTMLKWNGVANRRIYFIGDSIMRQVFISVGCLAWNDMVVDYAIPWFDKDRAVKMNHPNTIGAGKPHSKFEEGRIRLRNNIELIYHHGIGRLLDLGNDYQSHESPEEGWVKACYTNQPLTALVPKLPDWSSPKFTTANQKNDVASSIGLDPRSKLTTSNVERERLQLSSDDIVVLNAGVHSTRTENFQNINDLFRCKKQMLDMANKNTKDFNTNGQQRVQGHSSIRSMKVDISWPHFHYLVTSPAHFPTANGAYDRNLWKNLGNGQGGPVIDGNIAKFTCKQVTNYTVSQIEEADFCDEHDIPLIGTDMLPLQRKSGDLHVGAGGT
jgi:hypothetical protein